MQAASGHNVGLPSEDSGGCIFHVHQVEKPERPLGMVKKEVNIRIVARLASRGRAKQVKMIDSEPLQLGLVLLELGNSFTAFQHCTSFSIPIAICCRGISVASALRSARSRLWP